MTFANRWNSVAVVLPDWVSVSQDGGVKLAVPYLERGHFLNVIETPNSTRYVLGSTEDHLKLSELHNLDSGSVLKSAALSDFTVVEIFKDGTWRAYADRFGFYPLYYCEEYDGSLCIWFDLRQVAQSGKSYSHLYCAVFLAGLNQTYPFDSFTVWQGVRQLSPGCMLSGLEEKKPKLTRVAEYPSADLELDQAVLGFRESVIRRLDFLLGDAERVSCDLSGGLDSSYTAAMLSNRVSGLQTVFLDDGEGNQNDRHWANTVAQQIHSHHRVLDYLSHSTVLGAEPNTLRTRMNFGFDESFRYATLAQYLRDLTIKFGATLHFNGHGGDELFGPNAAMSWSYLRYGHGSRVSRMKNIIGFASANKFKYSDFRGALSLDYPFSEELVNGFKRTSRGSLNSEKYDTSWLPVPDFPSYSTAGLHAEIERAIGILVTELREPYSVDRSQHRIAEDVVAHVSLLRGLNSFQSGFGEFHFASLFLSPSVISAAMALAVDDRFLARVAKPMLYHTWPQRIDRKIFTRQDKGEYSSATFSEFESVKSHVRDLLSSNGVLIQMGLLDVKLVEKALNLFSIDGTELDHLMRAAALEAWLSGK